MAVWERQPQWNTVMTSREMELKSDLKIMTCKNCGTTIFIAKGRKWFQMKGYECYPCGASGEENFINNRNELLYDIDDDHFDNEKPSYNLVFLFWVDDLSLIDGTSGSPSSELSRDSYEFRAKIFTMIPQIVEGNFVVRKAELVVRQ